ncbi:MAG: isochorismatase family cysteine hydrolase [Eubacteriales bacterium]|nr:isochorismatase family cysteine hydrolase [Eubacteriales bacterium]
MKVLLAVDIQNDFIDGCLGSAEAQAKLPNMLNFVEQFDGKILATLDTHGADYLSTREGRLLPIIHCQRDTQGHQQPKPLREALAQKNAEIFEKNYFASTRLLERLRELDREEAIEQITIIGICTDICVVSNAMLIKAYFPEVEIEVIADACAGTTKENHEAALAVMQSCQITIK